MKQLQITNLLMNYNFINSTKKPAFIRILLSSVILLLTFSLAEAQQVSVKQVKKHKSASKKIRENRMKKYDFDKKETEKEDDEYDGPDRAMEMEYKKTIDPATGIVPRERLMNALDKTKKSKDLQRSGQFATLGNFTWTERGPNTDAVGVSNGNTRPNSGVTSGRMRAINVDLADASGKTVWVAGVSGGLWKTTDITAASPNWILINDYLSNLAVTSITQDPSSTNKDIMYFCTGEAFFNSDAVRGNGVFKSTDHGLTWNLLASSQNANFYYCSKILCDAAGNVYVSTRNGVFRSIDGGTNWVNIAPTGLSARFSDMELSATGRLHVSSGIFSTCAYRFTDNPATVTTSGWTSPTSGYPSSSVRIELACSGNTLFAIPSNASYQVTAVYKSTDGGATWTANNFTAGNTTDFGSQAWFCLAIDIDPSNINNIIIGNLTCLKSTDGGSTWSKISEWVGTTGQYVHADQHIIKWYDNGNKLLIGCDGGIHYSSDKGVTIRDRNVGLRLKQFFSCATIPTANINYFLAGAQDNGVHKLTTAGLGGSTEVTGGDGGFVAIDQDETNYQFGSYVNNVYRRSSNSGTNWSSFYFYKGTSSTATNFGTFINPYDYDNTANIIYAGADAGEIFRWTTAQTTAAGTYYATTGFPTGATILTGITSFNSAKISAVAVSPFTSNRVYLGTDGGRVVYIDNANTITSSTAGTNISAAGFPAGTVSCINFGTTEQNLITCFSNYGVSNIWVSSNGGTSWTAIDGNLPDMPIRWCMFYPGDNSRAIIATETGVWNTDLINGVSTSWYAEPSFPSVKTNMLKYRSSDGMLIAATHGRGLFTTVLCILVTPTVNIAANPGTTICSGTPVTVTATANNTGGGTINYNFKIGAGSVQSSASNIYTSTTLANGNAVTCDITVTGGTCLTATTATSNGLTMVVNPNLTPTVSIAANPGTTICSGTSVTITATANNTGGGTINYNFKIGAGSVQSSASNTYTTSSLANGNVVTCDITVTGGTCLTATTATSNGLTIILGVNSFTGNGNWTDIARWTCGSVPLPTDAIEIAAGANAILNIDLSLLGSLLMNATSTLTVDPTNTFDVAVGGTANFNGQSVTFRSTNTGTASLGKILGALTGATNVTVERYIPNNGFRSWRLLSVPTAGSQTFNQAWQEGNSSLQNSKPGFGTQITGIGSLSSAQAAGFDNTSPYPALLSYNVLSNIWEGMPSTNTALSTKNGYFLYVRGDRTQGISGLISNSSATTLRTTGTVYQGNLNSEIIPANSFGLIGNLYPSAIDFTKLNRSAGINNQFYIWDSKKGSATSSSLGIYQSFSNTNGFQTLIGGGSFVLGLPNISIQSGQAYFVQAGASSGTVTLNENAKISSNGTLGFRPTVPLNQLVKLDSKLYTNTGTSSEINDANVVVFDNGYANAVDADDALKLANSGENFGIAKGDKTLVIEGRLTINSKDTIFFKLWNLQQKSYSFEFVPQNLGTTGLIAMLQDSYLNSNTPLDLNSTNTINFTVDANTASADSNRFKIVFTASNPLPLSFISIAANRNGTDVLVDWKVAAENRINYYEMERSTDGRNFVTAGTVSSTGNNNPTSQYRFTDANIALKTWFYRIKSVGITGEIRYSSIVKLVAGNVKPGFSLSPNPVEGGIINLQFKNQPEGKYSVRILNNLGQQLQNTIISHAGRNSNQLLQLPGTIASGTYQIEIIAPDLTNTIKTLLVNRK